MPRVLLYIVTNDQMAGARSVMHCALDMIPGWVRIVSEPKEIAALPAGAKCIGIWSSKRGHRSMAEWAWIERRERGDLDVGMTGEEIDKLQAWIAKRAAGSAAAASDATQEHLDIHTESVAVPRAAYEQPVSQRWI